MVYNWIDGSVVLADVMDRFNIETTDWYNRVGYWIENGLADLKLLPTAQQQCNIVNAKDYMVELPTTNKSLIAVEVMGYRIPNSTQIKKKEHRSSSLSYTLLHNGYIRLETDDPKFSDVEVKIYYKGYKREFNKTIHSTIPLVPDKSIVIEALSFYVLKHILGRGYEHPVYSLSGRDPYLNVNIIYAGHDGRGGLRKRAMIEAKTMNLETREKLSARINTFLVPDEYDGENFDGNVNPQ